MMSMRCIILLIVLLEARTPAGKAQRNSQPARRKLKDVVDHHGNEVTRQIEKFLRAHSYELSIRPPTEGPVVVDMSLVIESISDISEKNMDLTFTLCIHESWKDERLKFKSFGSDESVVLPSRLVEKLWVPVGSKNSFVHKTTTNNVVLRLFSDGRILYKIKITTTVSCQMNLYNFPLDMESCVLKLRSLGYSSDELVLKWAMGETMEELFMDTKMVTNMPKFRLVHHLFDQANVSHDGHVSTNKNRPDGQYTHDSRKVSELRIQFELKRYLLSCLFQSYFPAMVMVVLAGLGMWIDPNSVPARVALGVTSVLTISTVITGLKGSLPKVSYLTAMDIYLWVCFLFVFSTVLEFCVLNFFMTKRGEKFIAKLIEKRRRRIIKRSSRFQHRTRIPSQASNNKGECFEQKLNRKKSLRRLMSPRSQQTNHRPPLYSNVENATFAMTDEVMKPKLCCKGFEASSVDAFFRVWYFVSFIVFNVIYWAYYVTVTQHGEEPEPGHMD